MKLYYKFENYSTRDEGVIEEKTTLQELATQLSGEFITQVLYEGQYQINVERTDTTFKITCGKEYAMCKEITDNNTQCKK